MVNIDKLKILKRLIIVIWITLIACFIIKMFGGNYFEIFTTNEKFIKISNYIDNHLFIKYTIYLIINLITNTLYLLAVCGKKRFTIKQLLIIFPILITFYFLKLWNSKIGLVTDLLQAFILPLFFIKFKKWYRIPIGFILDFIFQLITLLTKNLGLINISIEESFLINIIWCIDYYIMLIIMYLYSIQLQLKKEGQK